MTLKKKFFSCVNKKWGCWNWKRGKSHGYGVFYFSTGNHALAHRVSWTIQNGKIPDGFCVLHKCDNPSCVRPSHLFIGTMKENTADAIRKGRMAHGERHGRSKLRREDVVEIRRAYKNGIKQREIGAFFGVSQPHVGRIVRKDNWRK